LQADDLWKGFYASLARKMGKTVGLAAKPVENVGYEVCSCKFGHKRAKKQPTRVWAGCLKKEGRNQSDLPK